MAVFNRQSMGIEVVRQLSDRAKGKIVLITGTSAGGLGAETAISLAHGSPAHILLLARSASKVDPLISAIHDVNPGIVTTFVSVSLDSSRSVRSAAETVNNMISRLDILINNAGIMATPYSQNDAGIESQLATNHVGHFLLTKLLMKKILAAGAGARIVNVSSDGYTISPFRFDDWNFSNGETYDPWSGYGQSKTANILFTRSLATKYAAKGILSYAVHPGVIFDTSLSGHLDPASFGDINDTAVKNTGVPFSVGEPKMIQEGVATTLVAALDPGLADNSGSYLEDCTIHPLRSYASSAENAERLWSLSEKLIGGDNQNIEVWEGLDTSGMVPYDRDNA